MAGEVPCTHQRCIHEINATWYHNPPMGNPERAVGDLLADELIRNIPERLRVPVAVDLAPGTTMLVEDGRFLALAQELVDNCAQKISDTPIEVAVGVTYEEATDMFRMRVADNIVYTPEEVRTLVADLNSATPTRRPSRRQDVAIENKTKWIALMRRTLEAWGGGLVYSETGDLRIMAEATWTKQGMLTVEPPAPDPENF